MLKKGVVIYIYSFFHTSLMVTGLQSVSSVFYDIIQHFEDIGLPHFIRLIILTRALKLQ